MVPGQQAAPAPPSLPGPGLPGAGLCVSLRRPLPRGRLAVLSSPPWPCSSGCSSWPPRCPCLPGTSCLSSFMVRVSGLAHGWDQLSASAGGGFHCRWLIQFDSTFQCVVWTGPGGAPEGVVGFSFHAGAAIGRLVGEATAFLLPQGVASEGVTSPVTPGAYALAGEPGAWGLRMALGEKEGPGGLHCPAEPWCRPAPALPAGSTHPSAFRPSQQGQPPSLARSPTPSPPPCWRLR